MTAPGSTRRAIVNQCNLSAWVIASRGFQDDPQPLEIEGVRRADRRLFEKLAQIDDPDERGQVFHDYVTVKFSLHEWAEHKGAARSSLRHTYVQFLHGWGGDSNGRSGAVLKAWVESRFGLFATYHHGRLEHDGAARARYAEDRMRGAARTMGVAMQLDLLYTFCQDELRRRWPGERWRKLYRGTHDPEEYLVEDGACGEDTIVHLNNVSSCTSDREVAWEFGSSVWEVMVPMEKIVFFSGLLPPHLLGGECEYLVLGGEYRVKTLLY